MLKSKDRSISPSSIPTAARNDFHYARWSQPRTPMRSKRRGKVGAPSKGNFVKRTDDARMRSKIDEPQPEFVMRSVRSNACRTPLSSMARQCSCREIPEPVMVQSGKATGMGKARLGGGLGHIRPPGQQMATSMIQADLRQAVARREPSAFVKRQLQRSGAAVQPAQIAMMPTGSAWTACISSIDCPTLRPPRPTRGTPWAR